MDRYMKSVQKGKATASPELVKLWGTDAGSYRAANIVGSWQDFCMYWLSFTMWVLQDQHSLGKKLRELLLNHGSMKEVNVHIEREFIQDQTSLINTYDMTC